ncbi:T9SS type A sorting domain-containing protein [Sediminitomix flava]|uniref:Putative secreted protein (Por secretion system target) n=1 Tax=Sediminitomix flava TaxID=379075 RepID=A0A315YXZ3_SEDFL|nr:T9SS type A sorting domain-containing protein [Sediminitomix flava]PWJ34172.1 putative secreted protein (Por secretion system target) [Sediminitomix flava]
MLKIYSWVFLFFCCCHLSVFAEKSKKTDIEYAEEDCSSRFGSMILPNKVTYTLSTNLISFKVWMESGSAIIEWETKEETNSESFDIQKSLDGEHYESLFKVDASGSSNAIQYYFFQDDFPALGKNFYRLKQTAKDGSCSYSDPITVLNDMREKLTNSLHPAASHIFISKDNRTSLASNYDFMLYDEIGNQLKVGEVSSTPHAWEISVDHLIQGMYFLKISNDNGIQYEKIIVH